MNLRIGGGYIEAKKAMEGYYTRLTEYINSQEEHGYLRLLDSSNLSDEKDIVLFKMGQNKFLLRFTIFHIGRKLLIETYSMAKFPDTKNAHIPEFDIVCDHISDRYAGELRFITPQIVDFGGGEKENYYIEEFNPEYFFYLDRHIRKQNERRTEQVG